MVGSHVDLELLGIGAGRGLPARRLLGGVEVVGEVLGVGVADLPVGRQAGVRLEGRHREEVSQCCAEEDIEPAQRPGAAPSRRRQGWGNQTEGSAAGSTYHGLRVWRAPGGSRAVVKGKYEGEKKMERHRRPKRPEGERDEAILKCRMTCACLRERVQVGVLRCSGGVGVGGQPEEGQFGWSAGRWGSAGRPVS